MRCYRGLESGGADGRTKLLETRGGSEVLRGTSVEGSIGNRDRMELEIGGRLSE